jgi:hypothetical protein
MCIGVTVIMRDRRSGEDVLGRSIHREQVAAIGLGQCHLAIAAQGHQAPTDPGVVRVEAATVVRIMV